MKSHERLSLRRDVGRSCFGLRQRRLSKLQVARAQSTREGVAASDLALSIQQEEAMKVYVVWDARHSEIVSVHRTEDGALRRYAEYAKEKGYNPRFLDVAWDEFELEE